MFNYCIYILFVAYYRYSDYRDETIECLSSIDSLSETSGVPRLLSKAAAVVKSHERTSPERLPMRIAR